MYSYFNSELAQNILETLISEYKQGDRKGVKPRQLETLVKCGTGVLMTTLHGLEIRGFVVVTGMSGGRKFVKLSKTAIKILEANNFTEGCLTLDQPLSPSFRNCVIYTLPVEVARDSKYMASLPFQGRKLG